jgi:hypothetical protein
MHESADQITQRGTNESTRSDQKNLLPCTRPGQLELLGAFTLIRSASDLYREGTLLRPLAAGHPSAWGSIGLHDSRKGKQQGVSDHRKG